jgi:hypothetical protein
VLTGTEKIYFENRQREAAEEAAQRAIDDAVIPIEEAQ